MDNIIVDCFFLTHSVYQQQFYLYVLLIQSIVWSWDIYYYLSQKWL